jgi:hypothetical protein
MAGVCRWLLSSSAARPCALARALRSALDNARGYPTPSTSIIE